MDVHCALIMCVVLLINLLIRGEHNNGKRKGPTCRINAESLILFTLALTFSSTRARNAANYISVLCTKKGARQTYDSVNEAAPLCAVVLPDDVQSLPYNPSP